MLIRKTLAMAAATAGLIGAGMLTGASTASASVQPPESSGGVVQLVNENSGKCLEIADWRTDNGAPARQWDCTGGANQKWFETTDYYGRHTYVNQNSGKCLEIADWRTDNGAPARQWDCTGGANQRWYFDTIGVGQDEPSYIGHLLNDNSGNGCVVVQGTGNGSTAFQYTCMLYRDQNWYRR
ncbi:RICIN domain-containing protein [Streptomyces sp. NPDC021224]|uniref:RICIN domain-containing protein n=1 Tax=unclassified Streptomyces TaxID=2593676 RepID=UPI0037A2606E